MVISFSNRNRIAFSTVRVFLPSGVKMIPYRHPAQRVPRARDTLGGIGALRGSGLADRDPTPSLADLVAYRGLVEGAREWPFDASTFLRFALYLMIPLGSWLGGALVERLIDALLE